MTKVIFVVANLDMGGAERHVVTLAPAIDSSRFEVAVLCLQHRGALFDLVDNSDVEAHCFDGGNSRLGAVRSAFRLWRFFRRAHPDVVVTSGFQAGIIGRVVARAAGVPATISWKHNIGHLGLVGVKERVTEHVLAPLTSSYIGVCYSQVRYLVDEMHLDPERIRIVYNSIPAPTEESTRAVSLGRSSIGLDEADLVVGTVASLRKEKDHATLLRAIAEMRQRAVNAVLVVVGDGPERSDLEELAVRLGVEAHVRFLGQRSDVLQLLPLFDVVALSSFTIECFPYAVLEAMAASRAVVATCVGGLPEMVEDGATGRLVPPRAPSAMAEAIEDMLTQPEKASRFGMAGRKRLESRWPFAEIVSSVEEEILKTLSSATTELVGKR